MRRSYKRIFGHSCFMFSPSLLSRSLSVAMHVMSLLLTLVFIEVLCSSMHLGATNMSSSDNDGMSTMDSELIHSQDLLRSSAFERSSESAHIDDISEEVASTGSSRGRQPDSAEFSASGKEPCLSSSVSINSHAMSHQVESKPETSTKKTSS